MQGMNLRREAAADEKTVSVTITSNGDRNPYVYVTLPDGTKVEAKGNGTSETYAVPVGGTIYCCARNTDGGKVEIVFRNRDVLYQSGSASWSWYYTVTKNLASIKLYASSSVEIRINEA